jgi:hypothetical protein
MQRTFRSLIAAAALIAGCALGVSLVRAQPTSVPDAAKLAGMAARFAPTDIGADLSKLSTADRRVLAKLIEASKIIDALFLRQVWAGNDAMLLDLVHDDTASGPRPAALLPDQQRPMVAPRSQRALRAEGAGEARRSQLLPGWRVKGRCRTMDPDAPGGGPYARHELLHRDPPRWQQSQYRALQP